MPERACRLKYRAMKLRRGFGFTQMDSETCLSIKRDAQGRIILLALQHVDDILFAGSAMDILTFERALGQTFCVGAASTSVSYFLDMEVIRDRSKH